MTLPQAIQQYDEGLFEPYIIVLYSKCTFPGVIHFKVVCNNREGILARYGLGATKTADLKSFVHWLDNKDYGHTLEDLEDCYLYSNHWQIMTATQFVAYIQTIFQNRKDPEI